jgi:hypothetical protein
MVYHFGPQGPQAINLTLPTIIDKTDGLHYQIDFGHDQTAIVSERQIVKD